MNDEHAQSRNDFVDVAVVGLGPVGITLCNILGQRGVRVVGIDASKEVYALPRALGMDHEVMRVFQNIGIADDLAASVSAYKDSEYHAADGTILRRFTSPPLPHSQGWPAYMTFVQPALEGQLRRKAASLETVQLRMGTEVVSLKTPETPKLMLRDCVTGETTALGARYVVGCDGGSSFIRRSLGIAFEDLIFDQPWLVVDMILGDHARDLPETNIQFCDPVRPHTYVVGPDRLRRWEFMMLPGENPEDINRPEWIWAQLAPWLKPGEAEMWRSATYRFHALVAESWRVGNVFLAGDACHMTPPFLAQGMVQGIKDAANLGWKLAHAVHGGSDLVLETYQQERRPFVHKVISITKALGHIICETDPEKAATRNTDMMALMATGKGTQVRQSLFPPIQQGLLAVGHDGQLVPGAGEMCPQPWIITAMGRKRLDDVVGSSLVLLTSGLPLGANICDRAAQAGLEVFAVGTSTDSSVYEEEDVLSGWLNLHGVRAVIVRPDRVVFGTAETESGIAALIDQLETKLGLIGSDAALARRSG
ncbi:bifunctional 3-(3-hydroxy-phenyl)propionate/3-hydroxycinnamic acid hydroxylase [Pararhizobium sp. LjRoot235]|uniref:bifunctional 3-(3-hydroxy-phenyl)propionate/3-hydroxycinnamic acid hydroxylase n=1 Tax=Pararhizobium sp. LjRoot235 TaxID=3342291 RepID=UPI003ECD1FF1